MHYELKIIIDGVELTEQQTDIMKSHISDVMLMDNISSGTMDIGSAASDCLIFTILDPFKDSFDGNKVEFYISPSEPDDMTEIEILDEESEDYFADEVIDEDESDPAIDENEDEGDELTGDELAEAEEAENVLENEQYIFLEGEMDTAEDENTDEYEEDVWHNAGVYYVHTQKNISDGVVLTCYDGFLKMNDRYIPGKQEATAQEYYDDIRRQIYENYGIESDEFQFEDIHNVMIRWDFECSYRKAYGYLAGIVGGFAAFDEAGILGISFYTFTGNIMLESELLSYTEDSSGEMLLDAVACNRSLENISRDIIETGPGQGISFCNPFVTEEILNDIYETYRGIRFRGAVLAARWSDSVLAGEFIRIFTKDEYKNYSGLLNTLENSDLEEDELQNLKSSINSLGKIILVSSQRIIFAGEAVSVITSICESESAKESQIESSADIKIGNIYNGVVDAKTAAEDANKKAETADIILNGEYIFAITAEGSISEDEIQADREILSSVIQNTGIYEFIYSDYSWYKDGELITLSDYGITLPEIPSEGDIIRIECSKTGLIDDISDISDMVENIGDDVDSLEKQASETQKTTEELSEATKKLQAVQEDTSRELKDAADTLNRYKGYIKIDESEPSITIGAGTDSNLKMTPDRMLFMNNGNEAASLSNDRLKAESSEITNLYMRSVDNDGNTVGILGWVARANGHLSLKVIGG